MYPTLLHFGHVVLPTFGVLAAAGLMLGLGLSLRTAQRVGLDADAVWDAGLFAVVAAFVLSRALLVLGDVRGFLTYPTLLLAVPSLTVWGLAATAVVVWVWLRRHRLPVLAVLDAWAPGAALIWGFLALGHFAEGSDPGLPWRFGLRLPGTATPLVPVALYGAVVAWGLAVGLLRILGRRRGETVGLAVFGAGVGEFGLGFLRQPDLSGVTTLLDVEQWVGLAMVVVGLVVWSRSEDLVGDRACGGADGIGGRSASRDDFWARIGKRTSAAEAGERARRYGMAEAVPLSTANERNKVSEVSTKHEAGVDCAIGVGQGTSSVGQTGGASDAF